MEFKPEDWFTPNTYDTNFAMPKAVPGVYLITDTVFVRENGIVTKANYNIIYVGSSSNLAVRYSKHEVLRMAKRIYDYVQFYWLPVHNHIEREVQLIQHFSPKFNIQHNG